MGVALQLSDIQSNVLRGYRYQEALDHAVYVFVTLGPEREARAWLGAALAQVVSCTRYDELDPLRHADRFVLNLAFTFAGLRLLGLPVADAKAAVAEANECIEPGGGVFSRWPAVAEGGAFPDECLEPGGGVFSRWPAFVEGAAARGPRILGDTDDSEPERWEKHFKSAELHVVVSLSAHSEAGIESGLAAVTALLAQHAAREIGREIAAAGPGGAEHFGFKDGIAQPEVEGSGLPDRPGGGTPQPGGGWLPVRAGEFVLGEVDSFGIVRTKERLLVNGSFLVLRKLHERVAAFRRYTAELAARTAQPEELVAARFVGRWRSGTPLALAPLADNPAIANDPARINAFGFEDDPNGYKTPFGAHIRRANPRDDTTGPTPIQTEAHRIIRRALPYGANAVAAIDDDDRSTRGVLFGVVNASIERQFEFVLANWINSTLSSRRLTLDADKDPLIGANDGNGKFMIPGASGPTFAWNLPRFVITRGTVYLFLPGLRALALLAEGQLAGEVLGASQGA